ncbi:hypothetical protein GH714_011688 [Hevea brasiliensis]|uniref:Leucine-rich repeat-containing N-terminal plant-type domain-containing protein n=1 Tax=Hevea brasiliensis TaxID=3981 RepID=A0A6A6MZ32_HEVBR|nr:hypothetical protein GH714_011688 [Hevea brasiliensis]
MATGAADVTLRRVFDGSISIHDVEIDRRPYHRNCDCALHKFNGVCWNACSRPRNVSFPKKQALAHCSLSFAASKFSSQSSILSDYAGVEIFCCPVFSCLPHLKDLEYIALDWSIINDNILQSIGVMSSLKKLSLRGCELNDTKFLNQGLPHLKDLEYLALDWSIINNNILQSIGVMSSLKKLSLRSCELNDTKFLNQGVCKLKQLQELDISDNEISDRNIFAELRYMDLSSNDFNGSIPSSFGNMSFLRSLDLSNNSLSSTIPKHLTMDCVSLREVYLSKNQLQGSLEDAFCDCPELVVLDLSHNNMIGSIPSWIGRFSQLSYIILGHNNN